MAKYKLQVRYAFGDDDDFRDALLTYVGGGVREHHDAIQALLERFAADGSRRTITVGAADQGWKFRLAQVDPTKAEKVAELRRLLDAADIHEGSRNFFCSGVLGRAVNKDYVLGWRVTDLSEIELDTVLGVARGL